MASDQTQAVPATMVSKPRLFFTCPHCGDDTSYSVTHFLDDKDDHSFGPWQCDACGWVVYGIWYTATQTVSITELIERPKQINGYLLLRVSTEEPVWLIVENPIYTRDTLEPMAEEIRHKEYWVNEHTCPTNIVRVEAIIAGQGDTYDDDPHGVLQFSGWAPAPPDGSDPEDWRVIFPQLATTTIDGAVYDPIILIGDAGGVRHD